MRKEEIEIWKDIPGLNAQASSFGRIKSFGRYKDGRIRKLQKGLRANYLRVQLQLRGKYHSVHRLVAMAWIDNPNNLEVVNHKDGNGLNNRPENLEWCDQKHNVNHANNRIKNRKFRRFTQVEKQVIKESFSNGFSKLSIGNYFNATDTTIRRICI